MLGKLTSSTRDLDVFLDNFDRYKIALPNQTADIRAEVESNIELFNGMENQRLFKKIFHPIHWSTT